MKRTEDPASNEDNFENNIKDNEKPCNQVEMISSLRKRERQALENITQNAQNIRIKVPKINDDYNNLLLLNTKSEKGLKQSNEKLLTSSFNVEYELGQQILTFNTPNGRTSIKTQDISPIVDKEAPGPRQSLRNLPATKPPKLLRTNSIAKRKRILDGPNFKSISSEYKQYKRDCLRNLEENSWMYVIDRRFLHTIDSLMKNRNHAILWLIDINKMFQERSCVLLNAFRIFDIVLASVCIPRKLYILVASTAFWISAKIDNAQFTSLGKILKSNDSYTKHQYIHLEIKILHLLNYNINTVDPTLIVDYICMKMENNKSQNKNTALLYHSSYFFLELFSLHCTFASTDPIIMAIAAVRSSMKLLPMYRKSVECNNLNVLANVVAKIKSETSEGTINELYVHSQMIFLLTLACETNHSFHDLFLKYHTADYCYVTDELRNNLSRREIIL